MKFLEEQFRKDWSSASADELESLKIENERRAAEAEFCDKDLLDHMPLWLNMTNTTKCNLKCIMCNQAYGKIEELRMNAEVYNKIVKEFYPFLRTVQLTAIGEPMMTPHLLSKIDDMIHYGVKLEMVTNGVLMKGDALLSKLAASSELITLSLDGATPETFNSIRQGADFHKIIKNIERFNHFRFLTPEEKRTRLNINFILMKRNIRELPDLVDIAANLGVQTIICSHLVLYEKGLEEEMLIHHPKLSNQFTAQAAKRAAEHKIEIILPPPFIESPVTEQSEKCSSIEPPLKESSPDSPATYQGERCYFLWRRVYIGHHGQVVPCCLSGIDAFGSIENQPFPEVWNNPRYQHYRRRVHTLNPPEHCKTCYLINRNPVSADFRKL